MRKSLGASRLSSCCAPLGLRFLVLQPTDTVASGHLSSIMSFFIVLELATGFTNKYSSFLACRALFGIAMGGLYGNTAATAMEDCPPAARGIISGMFQVGCSLGYLLATVFARALVDTTPYGWRPLFWFGLVHQCCSYSFSSASLKQRAIKNDNV